MTHLKSRSVAAVTLLALLALATVLLVGSRAGSAGAASEPTTSVQEPSILAPATAETRAALSDEEKAWADELKGGIYPLLKGEEVTGIEKAHTPANGDFTLIELGGHVCVQKHVGPEEIGASGCAGIPQVESGTGYIVTPGCGEDEVVGFMPNGISSLSVETAGRAKASVVPVISNMYAVTVPSVNTTVSGITNSGKEISVNIPLDTFPSNCL